MSDAKTNVLHRTVVTRKAPGEFVVVSTVDLEFGIEREVGPVMSDEKGAGPRIEVVEMATGKVVHTIPLSGTADRFVERVMLGLLAHLDRDVFCAREVLQ